MMTERLQRVLQHIEEISPAMQDELATQIEDMLAPMTDRESYFGVMSDLPDDMEEELLRMRRAVPPTPPMDEQLRWLDEEDSE